MDYKRLVKIADGIGQVSDSKERFLELFRECVRKDIAEEAGNGMYNIDLGNDEEVIAGIQDVVKRKGEEYAPEFTILQAYPFREEEADSEGLEGNDSCYGDIYVLLYYQDNDGKYSDKGVYWDDDYRWDEFSPEEQNILVGALEELVKKDGVESGVRRINLSDSDDYGEVLNECREYMMGCDDKEQASKYRMELNKASRSHDIKYLVGTGLFHDAIGKVQSLSGGVVTVLEEY